MRTGLRIGLAFWLVTSPACGEAESTAARARWQVLAADLPEALLGVWGSGAEDVWIVGSDAGAGPIVAHFDGRRWRRIPTGTRGALWWVWSAGEAAPIWMAGDGGIVLKLERGEAAPRVIQTPSDKQLFGVFPVGPEVFAVGGDVNGQRGEVWRLRTDAFEVDVTVPAEAASRGAFFKAWGRSPEDLWVVGLGGVALHRGVGGQWRTVAVPDGRRLFTVHGAEDEVIAVGGFQSGLAVGLGAEARDLTGAGLPQLNGVWVQGAGRAVGVGVQGEVRRWDGQVWRRDPEATRGTFDWHAVYADPGGGLWTVGGFVVSEPLSEGRLAHYGARTIPPLTR